MMTEDLDAFLSTEEHAIEATYKAGGIGAGVPVDVIFDNEYAEPLPLMAGTSPAALGKASDFASWTDADTLTIDGVVYRLTNSKPQDDGAFALLTLEKQ